ncbi:hypothetical protein XELAEV_18030558mg [Xenopus laevis]|uniref:Uncharacterized protein n=1 Tax=Xenopus laevis TaxID=8355 RepID=A0A974HEW9_XENLA|nr:hypothetical protein XELAEV_18030558mg [Xenopus laevis]
MRNWLRVSIIAATCAALFLCAPRRLDSQSLRDQDVAVERLIDFLNNGQNGNFIFKLRSIESGRPNKGLRIKVTLQETLCLISEAPHNKDCPLDPDGEVKVCLLHMEQKSVKSAKCSNNVKDRNNEAGVQKRALNSTTLGKDSGGSGQISSCLECIFGLFNA